MDADWHNPMMLVTCYKSIGDEARAHNAAMITLERAQRATAKDPSNGPALAAGAIALAMTGEKERAREWMRRALAFDPDNLSTRYNLACSLLVELNDPDAALELLQPYFENLTSRTHLRHLQADPDLDPIRDHPHFKKMLASTKRRLGMKAAAE